MSNVKKLRVNNVCERNILHLYCFEETPVLLVPVRMYKDYIVFIETTHFLGSMRLSRRSSLDQFPRKNTINETNILFKGQISTNLNVNVCVKSRYLCSRMTKRSFRRTVLKTSVLTHLVIAYMLEMLFLL